jgi:hypothetical protein
MAVEGGVVSAVMLSQYKVAHQPRLECHGVPKEGVGVVAHKK